MKLFEKARQNKNFDEAAIEKRRKRNELETLVLPFAGLVFVVIFFTITTRGGLLSRSNLSNMVDQAFTTALASLGAVFIYAHGGFDMSMGAISGVSQLIAGTIIVATGTTLPPILIVLICVAVCVVFCVINAVIHVYLTVPIFIVTLCMNFACTGILTTAVANGEVSFDFNYLSAYNNTLFRFIVLVLVVIAAVVLFEKTKIGKIQKAIGGSRVVAAQSGIKVKKYIIIAFALSGVCLGIASFFMLSRTCFVTGSQGSNIQTNVMIAIVMGGMPLSGGSASKMRSALVGAVTITVLINGLTLMGCDTSIVNGVKGILFLVIVALSYQRPAGNLIS